MKKKDLALLQDKLPDTRKFNAWLEEWLSNGGNATRAALKCYDTTDPNTAGVIGSENLKKLKNAGALYLQSKGIGYGDMLDRALKHMDEVGSSKSDWWDRIMKMCGWEPPARAEIGLRPLPAPVLNSLTDDDPNKVPMFVVATPQAKEELQKLYHEDTPGNVEEGEVVREPAKKPPEEDEEIIEYVDEHGNKIEHP